MGRLGQRRRLGAATAILAFAETDPFDGERWRSRLRFQGDADGMVRLALLLHGRGDRAEAQEWMRRAAYSTGADLADLLALLQTGE